MIVNKLKSVPVGTQFPVKGISDLIEYVRDPFKTLVPQSNRSEINLLNINTVQDFIRDIVLDPDGNVRVNYVSSYRCALDDFLQRCEQLQQMHRHFHGAEKTTAICVYHIVFSFPPDTLLRNEDIHNLGCTFLQKQGCYPGIISSHIEPVYDAKSDIMRGVCKHCHLLICAYPDDPDFQTPKFGLDRYLQSLRELSDELAIEFAQPIIVDADYESAHSWTASLAAKKDKGWMHKLKVAAEEAAATKSNLEDYILALEEKNYSVVIDGPDLIYRIPADEQQEEHSVTAKALGRQYTRESLQDRWDNRNRPERDHTLDILRQSVDGPLYAMIPLSGRSGDDVKRKMFRLDEVSPDYTSETLLTYFLPHVQYDITDRNGDILLQVNGRQILDYLYVDEERIRLRQKTIQELDQSIHDAADVSPKVFATKQEALLAGHKKSLDAEYQRHISRIQATADAQKQQELQQERERELEEEQKRIERQLAWKLKKETQSRILQDMYKREEEERRKRYRTSPREKYYEPPKQDDNDLEGIPLILACTFKLIVLIVFEKDLDDTPSDRAKKNEEFEIDFGPTDWAMQMMMDTYSYRHQTGFPTASELLIASQEATKQYNETLQRLAEINTKLNKDRSLYYAAITYRRTAPEVKRLLSNCDDPSVVRKEHADLFREYDSAVACTRAYAIRHWYELDQVCVEYRYLRDLRAGLLEAVAVQYEAHREMALYAEIALESEMRLRPTYYYNYESESAPENETPLEETAYEDSEDISTQGLVQRFFQYAKQCAKDIIFGKEESVEEPTEKPAEEITEEKEEESASQPSSSAGEQATIAPAAPHPPLDTTIKKAKIRKVPSPQNDHSPKEPER